MSSLDLLPYNVTLSSQTASIQYLPSRESPIESGWNTTYSDGAVDTGYGRAQGLGADYHRTSFAGATMEFGWTGTAVYLYGNATAGSYNISVDDELVDAHNDVPQGGLLGSKTGLKYGLHSVKLSVLGNGSEVAFQYAQATIGVGKPGNLVQNRTILAVNEQTQPQRNEFFQWGQKWAPEGMIAKVWYPNGTRAEIPRQMLSTTVGDTLTFTVDHASAFFLWGAVNNDHRPKEAKFWSVDDAPGKSQTKVTKLDDGSNYLDFQQVLYWESGLDTDRRYVVEITNGPDMNGVQAFSFNRLEIIDGGLNSNSSLGSGSGNGNVGNSTGTGPDGNSDKSNNSTRLGVKPPSLPFSEIVLLLVTISVLKRLLWL